MTTNTKKEKRQYDFVGLFKPAVIASILIIAVTAIIIFARGGLDYNIEFNGGFQIQTGFTTDVSIGDLRSVFSEAGMKNVDITAFDDKTTTNSFKKEYVIKLEAVKEDAKTLESNIVAALDTKFKQQYEIRSKSFIGPKIGDELKTSAVKAFLIALFFILVYVSLKFKFKFAVASIVAMIHDLLITIGIYSVLGIFSSYEISLSVVASILTIIGYSLNDTIVVFDRIRENIPNYEGVELKKVVNISINETLSRTLLTSLTTIFAAAVLVVMGGEGVSDLAMVLLIGIVTGTYSSIFVASPVVIWWDNREKLKKELKEEQEKEALTQIN